MHGNETDLVALALDPKMHHSLAALNIAHPQAAQFLAADAVVEQGGENGAIADALEGVFGRRIEQLARLGVAERRRLTFVAIGHRPLDAVDRIAGHGIVLTEIVEQGRERRELAADAGGRQRALLEVLAPGDDMGAGDRRAARRCRAGR